MTDLIEIQYAVIFALSSFLLLALGYIYIHKETWSDEAEYWGNKFEWEKARVEILEGKIKVYDEVLGIRIKENRELRDVMRTMQLERMLEEEENDR